MACTILGSRTERLNPFKTTSNSRWQDALLQLAGQWKESEPPAVMAFKIQLPTQENMMSELIQQLPAHLTKITESCNNNNK
jgi:hypothetical protein